MNFKKTISAILLLTLGIFLNSPLSAGYVTITDIKEIHDGETTKYLTVNIDFKEAARDESELIPLHKNGRILKSPCVNAGNPSDRKRIGNISHDVLIEKIQLKNKFIAHFGVSNPDRNEDVEYACSLIKALLDAKLIDGHTFISVGGGKAENIGDLHSITLDIGYEKKETESTCTVS
ncbi:MAG TPA: hypothetical protein VMW10_04900 [Alphaproteobacteria bacterium]|nr:hypothetical protein [Alphaproteobacteria bacterium]